MHASAEVAGRAWGTTAADSLYLSTRLLELLEVDVACVLGVLHSAVLPDDAAPAHPTPARNHNSHHHHNNNKQQQTTTTNNNLNVKFAASVNWLSLHICGTRGHVTPCKC